MVLTSEDTLKTCEEYFDIDEEMLEELTETENGDYYSKALEFWLAKKDTLVGGLSPRQFDWMETIDGDLLDKKRG